MTGPDRAGSWSAPTGWPGSMGPVPPPPLSAARRPGIATAAAVLGFVEAGLVLLWLLPALVGGLVVGVAMAPLEFFATSGAAVLSGALLLGGVHLLRGVGWRLLVAATAVEIVLVLALVALAAAGGWRPGIVVLGLLLAMPTVRLGLLLPRSVVAWVERQDPAPNRWLGPLVLTPAAVALVLAVLSV